MGLIDALNQIYQNAVGSEEKDPALNCANERTDAELAAGKENEFTANYRTFRALDFGERVMQTAANALLLGSSQRFTKVLLMKSPGLAFFERKPPQQIKLDRDFKYIDNSPNGTDRDTNRGKISLEDAVVFRVLQPDGTWANRGLTVEEFLFYPQFEAKSGTKLDTLEKRVAFLHRVTGRPVADEIEAIIKSLKPSEDVDPITK